MAQGGGYKVVVSSNVVTDIRCVEAVDLRPETLIEDPLVASTRLSQNNLANGCLDGEYDFSSLHTARMFATLCLEFTQKLCENSLTSLGEASLEGNEDWHNPYTPDVAD